MTHGSIFKGKMKDLNPKFLSSKVDSSEFQDAAQHASRWIEEYGRDIKRRYVLSMFRRWGSQAAHIVKIMLSHRTCIETCPKSSGKKSRSSTNQKRWLQPRSSNSVRWRHLRQAANSQPAAWFWHHPSAYHQIWGVHTWGIPNSWMICKIRQENGWFGRYFHEFGNLHFLNLRSHLTFHLLPTR